MSFGVTKIERDGALGLGVALPSDLPDLSQLTQALPEPGPATGLTSR